MTMKINLNDLKIKLPQPLTRKTKNKTIVLGRPYQYIIKEMTTEFLPDNW